MYFLLNMGIFHQAMLVYQRVGLTLAYLTGDRLADPSLTWTSFELIVGV